MMSAPRFKDCVELERRSRACRSGNFNIVAIFVSASPNSFPMICLETNSNIQNISEATIRI